MRSFVTRIALIAAAFGAYFLYDTYDKASNNTSVAAKVTEVNTLCHLYKRDHLRRRSTTTNEAPCPLVRAAAESDPEYKDFQVRETTRVTYAYDVGGKTYSSQHVQSKKADGTAIAAGDTIEVLVSKTDPAKTRAK